MDAWFFLKSIGIGLAVAAPVGPMGLLCIHRTLERGRASGLAFGAGVAAGDFSYATIAAFGVTAVTSLLLANTFWIKLFGSIILVALGIRIARARPAVDDARKVSDSDGRAFLTAYGLTMANPPTILFFAGIFASVASIASSAQAALFAAGVFIGSMSWWVTLTLIVKRSAGLFSPTVLLWVNRVSGVALLVFAAYELATLL